MKPIPRRIIVLGPPGSGKGTQATLLAKRLKVPHISTGDIFREHIAKKTRIGFRVERLLRFGTLVPDALVNRIVRQRLARRDCQRGFVFDGFPRTIVQARFLDRHDPPSLVIHLALSEREVVRRLSGRRIGSDGAIYHLIFNPPPRSLLRSLTQRSDEKPATIHHRMREYRRLTAPLLRFYREQGLLMTVDGRPPIGTVTSLIQRGLARFERQRA